MYKFMVVRLVNLLGLFIYISGLINLFHSVFILLYNQDENLFLLFLVLVAYSVKFFRFIFLTIFLFIFDL